MSTPNFMNVNASKYFVLEIEDDFEFDIQKECLQGYLSEHGYTEENGHPNNDNRSYPSVMVASKSIEKTIADNPIEVSINVVIRSGYYAHVNLDWEIQIETGTDNFCDEIPEEKWIAEEFEYDFSVGFSKIQSKNVMNFIHKSIEELVEETENHLSKLTETYVRTALFSNGEAIYEKA